MIRTVAIVAAVAAFSIVVGLLLLQPAREGCVKIGGAIAIAGRC